MQPNIITSTSNRNLAELEDTILIFPEPLNFQSPLINDREIEPAVAIDDDAARAHSRAKRCESIAITALGFMLSAAGGVLLGFCYDTESRCHYYGYEVGVCCSIFGGGILITKCMACFAERLCRDEQETYVKF